MKSPDASAMTSKDARCLVQDTNLLEVSVIERFAPSSTKSKHCQPKTGYCPNLIIPETVPMDFISLSDDDYDTLAEGEGDKTTITLLSPAKDDGMQTELMKTVAESSSSPIFNRSLKRLKDKVGKVITSPSLFDEEDDCEKHGKQPLEKFDLRSDRVDGAVDSDPKLDSSNMADENCIAVAMKTFGKDLTNDPQSMPDIGSPSLLVGQGQCFEKTKSSLRSGMENKLLHEMTNSKSGDIKRYLIDKGFNKAGRLRSISKKQDNQDISLEEVSFRNDVTSEFARNSPYAQIHSHEHVKATESLFKHDHWHLDVDPDETVGLRCETVPNRDFGRDPDETVGLHCSTIMDHGDLNESVEDLNQGDSSDEEGLKSSPPLLNYSQVGYSESSLLTAQPGLNGTLAHGLHLSQYSMTPQIVGDEPLAKNEKMQNPVGQQFAGLDEDGEENVIPQKVAKKPRLAESTVEATVSRRQNAKCEVGSGELFSKQKRGESCLLFFLHSAKSHIMSMAFGKSGFITG